MTCDQWRELISAAVDGELDPATAAALDDHLAACVECRAFHGDAWALRRSLRLAPVTDPDRVAARAESGVAPVSTRSTGIKPSVTLFHETLRWLLVVCGGTLVIINARTLLGNDAVDEHLSRHDGVFGLALGVGMVVVAARPYRAIGLVPLTSVIAALMIVVAITDIIRGRVSMLTEAIHVVELVGLGCLWVLSGGPHRLHGRTHRWLRWPLRRTATAAPRSV